MRAAEAGLTANILQVLYFDDMCAVIMEMYTMTLLRSLVLELSSWRDPSLRLDDLHTLISTKFRECVAVISQLHALGLTHGDTHLNNFMYDQQDRLRLIDFGMSKESNQDQINHDYDLLVVSFQHLPEMPDETSATGERIDNFFVSYKAANLDKWTVLRDNIVGICLAERERLIEAGLIVVQQAPALSVDAMHVMGVYAEHLRLFSCTLDEDTTPAKEDIDTLLATVRLGLPSLTLAETAVDANDSYAVLAAGLKGRKLFRTLIRARNEALTGLAVDISAIVQEEQNLLDI